MGRKPMVTRTVNGLDCSVLCVNPQTRETFTRQVVVNSKYKDDDQLLKEVRKMVDSSDCRVVAVTESTPFRGLFGAEESEFLKIAKRLPPRNKFED